MSDIYTTADLNAMLAEADAQQKRARRPMSNAMLGGIVPQVPASEAAINRPDPVERASLFPLATYPDGTTRLALPGMIAEDIPRAFTAPARAYRGELPDEDMIAEGMNFAGNMAMGGSVVPKGASTAARVAANASESAAPGVVMAEAGRQIPPVKLEVPFYRGSTQPQTSVDYSRPYWGTTSKDLPNHYVKSRTEGYLDSNAQPNITPAVARFRNPLEIDAQNNGWSQIPFEGRTYGTDDLADLAKSRGHDGLVINRVYDEGRWNPDEGLPSTVAALGPGTVSSAFDPNNILYSNAKASAPGAIVSQAADQPRVTNPIRASHVSRNDFDKFDFSKIGSGFGHTDEGHGLYFGQHKGMLDSYAKEFGPDAKRYDVAIHADESKFGDWDTLPADIKAALKTERGAKAAAQSGMPGVVVKHPEGNSYVLFDQSTPIDILTKYQNPDTAKAPGALVAEAADQSAPRVPNPIRAYHGSPHDFDRFDISRIGTGEGAQAYGHGLYFAEREGVARSYRDALAGKKEAIQYNVNGQPVSPADIQRYEAAKLAHKSGGADKALADLRNKQNAPKAYRDAMERILSEMQARGDVVDQPPPNPGRMYEVNINAHPDDFLDWDKPLSQQSEKVRNAMRKLANDEILSTDTGEQAYRSAAFQMGAHNGKFLEHPELSARAKANGIPGIKYLDQGSRTAGEGSRNYVVFDDALIDILRKYMNPKTAAAPGVLMVEGAKDGRRQ